MNYPGPWCEYSVRTTKTESKPILCNPASEDLGYDMVDLVWLEYNFFVFKYCKLT